MPSSLRNSAPLKALPPVVTQAEWLKKHEELLAKEILFQSDLEVLIGKRPFLSQTTYEEYTSGQLEKNIAERQEATREQEAKEAAEIALKNSEAENN